MKNNRVTEALSYLKQLEKLASHECNGCIFNKLGECSVPALNCKNKEYFISHQEFADFINDDLKQVDNIIFNSYLYQLKNKIKGEKL